MVLMLRFLYVCDVTSGQNSCLRSFYFHDSDSWPGLCDCVTQCSRAWSENRLRSSALLSCKFAYCNTVNECSTCVGELMPLPSSIRQGMRLTNLEPHALIDVFPFCPGMLSSLPIQCLYCYVLLSLRTLDRGGPCPLSIFMKI